MSLLLCLSFQKIEIHLEKSKIPKKLKLSKKYIIYKNWKKIISKNFGNIYNFIVLLEMSKTIIKDCENF